MAIIIGIDPGLRTTGWGIINNNNNNNILYLACGSITTKKNVPLAKKLAVIYESLEQIILTYNPQLIALEEIFVNNNPKSSMLLCYARAMILLLVAKQQLPLYEYANTTVKKTIAGNGKASKEQILKMLTLLLPASIVDIKTEDTADALAIALCHANSYISTMVSILPNNRR